MKGEKDRQRGRERGRNRDPCIFERLLVDVDICVIINLWLDSVYSSPQINIWERKGPSAHPFGFVIRNQNLHCYLYSAYVRYFPLSLYTIQSPTPKYYTAAVSWSS